MCGTVIFMIIIKLKNEAQMFNAFQDATTSKMASIYKTVVQLFINCVCIFLNSLLLF